MRFSFKAIAATFSLAAWALIASAQHQDVAEKPTMWRGRFHFTSDTTSLLHALKSGQMHGHFRYYFMSTDNKPGLSDYYANAAGGGIRYESGKFHGFQVGISGFFIFNVGSSDLAVEDSLTSAANRYETALFDVEDPENKNDIDRLEEFQISYSLRKSRITFGKMLINTPLINLQDGRMRPTGVEGVWMEMKELKSVSVEGGYLYGFSPRGTTRWFREAESIGVFPTGLNPDGTRSGYRDNLKSKGVGVLGIKWQATPGIRVQAWNYYIDNIQNSALAQVDFQQGATTTLSANGHGSGHAVDPGGFFGGVQFVRQDAINHGGNEDQSKTYVLKGSKAMTYGARAGWRNTTWETSLSYNRITDNGRYLFPREWGRDPFYTFMPRERNDGYADVHAAVARVQYSVPAKRFKIALAGGYFDMPDVRDFARNKYGMPSYYQTNLDIRYEWKGILKGMETQILVVSKMRAGNVYDDMRYVINKVDMTLYHVVFNYHF
ncbi:MAG: OprD family outer membrane porin [Flavobacteriales bacterium]